MISVQKIKQTLLSAKGSTILLAAGMAGIALIFLSSVWPSSSQTKSASSAASSSATSDYAAQLEQNLRGIVGSIAGVGRVRVMVTLESGVQYVYEQNQKTTQSSASTASQTQQATGTEESTVLAQTASGGQQALIQTERQPQVRVVVMVCDGGNDPAVQEQVLEAVSTALGVSVSAISISPMAAASSAR